MLDSTRPVDHPGASGDQEERSQVGLLEREAGSPPPATPTGAPGHGLEILGDGRILTEFPSEGELEPTFFETLRDHQRRQAAGHAATVPPHAPPSGRPPHHRPHEHLPERRPSAPVPAQARSAQAPEALPGPFPERAGSRGTVSGTARAAAAEDEKLLTALSRLVSVVRGIDSLFPRLVFFFLGFTAISALALAYIEALPLPAGAAFLLGPAVLTMLLLGTWFPTWGRRALIGWGAGIAATIIYDVARLAAVELGVFGDPIPAIGNLLLNREDVPWTVGYAWRFLGNGGGMAIAFTMLPWRGVKAGTVYGTLICLGLFAVLFFFPVAQAHFFPLEPLTAVVAMLGHWIYGAVLGGITKRYLPPVTVRAARHAGGTWIPRAAAPAV